jgi:hypothetical protein
MNKFACRKKRTIDIFLIFCHDILAMILFRILTSDTSLNLMKIEQERLYGFGSYLSIRCTPIAVLFHLFHSPVALPFHPIVQKFYLFVEYGLFSGFFMNKFACRKKMTIEIFLINEH